MNFHWVPPHHLTFVRQHKACKVTSTQTLSRKLCGLPSNVIPDSMKTKPESFLCTEYMAFPVKPLGELTQEMDSVDIANHFQTLSATQPIFPLIQKKKKALITCYCFSSLITLHSTTLSQQLLMLKSFDIGFSSRVAGVSLKLVLHETGLVLPRTKEDFPFF